MSDQGAMVGGPQPPSDWGLDQIARSGQFALYWQVSATVIALYDHATTLDLEIELIWKKKFSLVHVLYLINRYVGNAVLIHGTTFQLWLRGDAFVKACESGALVQMGMSMVAVWAMQSIIINRVWCMYGCTKAILIILVAALLAEIGSSVAVVVTNSHLISAVIPINESLVFCVPVGFSPKFFTFWLFILAFDALIFGLALWEGVRYFQESKGLRGRQHSVLGILSWPWVAEKGSIIRVLLRDSILFPFITMMSCLANLLAWFEIFPFGGLQATLVLSALLSPILGCRLILNLRDVYYQPFAAELNPRPKSVQLPGLPSDLQASARFARSEDRDHDSP